jgi:FMN phosphatase YigB (HAD superfamily)
VTFDAVIFDIGGVLERNPRLDWHERWAARLELTEAELDLRLQPILRDGSIGSIGLPEVERQIGASLDLQVRQLGALMDDLWAEYVGTLNQALAAYFAALRPRYRTGILSNSFVGAREREQQAYGFGDMCDVVVYSHEEGMRKPDPAFYELVCRRSGREPPARAVSRRPADVRGGRSARGHDGGPVCRQRPGDRRAHRAPRRRRR